MLFMYLDPVFLYSLSDLHIGHVLGPCFTILTERLDDAGNIHRTCFFDTLLCLSCTRTQFLYTHLETW